MQEELFEKPVIDPRKDRFSDMLLRHLRHDYDHEITGEVNTNNRPRARAIKKKDGTVFATMYMESDYEKYCEQLVKLISIWKSTGVIPPAGYTKLVITFYYVPPKSYPKRYFFTPHIEKVTKPDVDNMVKTIMDCMTKSGIFGDDGAIADLCIRKCYTLRNSSYIAFNIA